MHLQRLTIDLLMAFVTTVPLLRTLGAGALCTRGVRIRRRPVVRAAAGACVGLDAKWAEFAAEMKRTNISPDVDKWNELLDECIAAGEAPGKAIWVISTMRATGRGPTAASYQRVLQVCAMAEDRAAAFHLVELMWKDGVLLGDVDLPDGMEDTLRSILPPEAFD